MDPFYHHHVGHNVINLNYDCEISAPQWCHQSKLGANDPSCHHDQFGAPLSINCFRHDFFRVP